MSWKLHFVMQSRLFLEISDCSRSLNFSLKSQLVLEIFTCSSISTFSWNFTFSWNIELFLNSQLCFWNLWLFLQSLPSHKIYTFHEIHCCRWNLDFCPKSWQTGKSSMLGSCGSTYYYFNGEKFNNAKQCYILKYYILGQNHGSEVSLQIPWKSLKIDRIWWSKIEQYFGSKNFQKH